MQPHPTDHPGLLRIPGPALNTISVRFARLSDRDRFNPSSWEEHPLAKSSTFAGWWEIDLDLLALRDGDYEYEFVVNGSTVVADPYAEQHHPFRRISRDIQYCWWKAGAKAILLGRRDVRLKSAFRRTTRS